MAQISIIGLGTVGSSLGLALHQYQQALQGRPAPFTIVGYDPLVDMHEVAGRKDGSIDKPAWDLPSAVREASVVVLALPTGQMQATLRAIAPHLAAGATVTDTAPNKRAVLQWAREALPAGVSFVGGHPLPRRVPAPTVRQEDVVDEPPQADLFQDAPYCILPLPTASEAAVNQVIGLAEAVGARPFFTDVDEHDSFQAAMHDLPVLTGFALMQMLSASPAWRDMGPLAGGAFREGTRMASTDPTTARTELVANRANVIGWLDRYLGTLQNLRDWLADPAVTDPASPAAHGLVDLLIAGRNARTGWLNPKATLTAAEREARDTARGAAGGGVLRNMLGGFLSDRLPGGRDPERKDRP